MNADASSGLSPGAQPKRVPWYKDGLCFECTQCGKCCTGFEGYVWVTKSDVAEIAEFLGVDRDTVQRRYVRKVGRRYSLIEKPNLDCVFWEQGQGCTIYSARPPQCRTFPFWRENLRSRKAWDEVESDCPGSGKGRVYSQDQIDAIARGEAEAG